MHFHNLLNKICNYKSFCLKSSRFDKETNTMVIKVLPRKNGVVKCSVCGQQAPVYDTLRERRYTFIPYCNMKVELSYAKRRTHCPLCGIHAEEVPWSRSNSPITNELKAVLSEEAKDRSTSDVAKQYKTSWHAVDASVSDAVDYGMKQRELGEIKQIGIDEIAWQSGHRYITLVYQLDPGQHKLLWVGAKRTKETMTCFFDEMEQKCPGFASRLTTVCTDMWKPYTDVIAERAPQARNILDRFHIVKKLNEALEKIRKKEFSDTSKAENRKLAYSKYCLLKDPKHLSESQLELLEELKKLNLQSIDAYLLKEQLRVMWNEYMHPDEARRAIQAWSDAVNETKLTPLKKVAATIMNKLELILNYFRVDNPPSSGIVEGLNRKVNLSIRKAYGFRCFSTAQHYLLHQLGKLSPLPFTHTIC